MRTTGERLGKLLPRPLASLALFAAVVGIAAGFVLSNAGPGSAATCAANPSAAAAIDASATGELAALLPTATGRGYADLAFLDAEGADATLGGVASQPMLVNFWATWCVPCREEMPALDALAERYAGQGFSVVTINLDLGADGRDKAKAFLDEEQLRNLPLYADPSYRAFERLKANGVALGLPATLLLDEKGCEIAVLQGPAEWNSDDAFRVIDALLALEG